ncbi:MAG: exosortase [Reinekea sp.]|nr:exosortase [Reinekea sp.]
MLFSKWVSEPPRISKLFTLLSIVFCWSLVAVISGDALGTLHDRWTRWDENYSHGYVLLCFALLECARRFNQSPLERSRLHSVLGLGLYLIFLAIWVVGVSVQMEALQLLAIPGLFFSTLYAFAGKHAAISCLPTLALLLLAIPVWDILVAPLQSLTTVAATFLVKLFSVSAFIEGNQFTLPAGVVYIAGGCSGLAFFLMALTLSAINAINRRYPLLFGFMTIALFASMAIVGNWIRVTALILIAYYSEMQSPLVSDHALFGWLIFAGLFVVFVFTVRGLEAKMPAAAHSRSLSPSASGSLSSGLFLLVVIVVTTAIVSFRLPNMMPVKINSATESSSACWMPPYVGYDHIECRQKALQRKIWDYVVLTYHYQKQGKELISSGNRLANSGNVQVISDNGRIQVAIVQESKKSRVVIWSYRIGGKYTTDALTGKLLQLTILLKPEQAVSFVALVAPCSTNCETLARGVNLEEFGFD